MRQMTDKEKDQFGHPPKQGDAKYIKDLRSLIQELEQKQGTTSQTHQGLFDYWSSCIRPYGTDKEQSNLSTKINLPAKSEGESKLKREMKIKRTYSKLRPIDVKYTLKHDDWRLKIDKAREEESQMAEFQRTAKKRENEQLKNKLMLKFQKHMEAEWRGIMEGLNKRMDQAQKEKKKRTKQYKKELAKWEKENIVDDF